MRRPIVAVIDDILWQTDASVLHALDPGMKWQERFGEGKLKVLGFDPDTNAGTYLAYWPANYDPLGYHGHGGNEELLVLQGELRAGEHVYRPGTYLFMPAGQRHGPLVPGHDGCVFLMMVDGPLFSDDFLGELRTNLKATRYQSQD